MFQCRFLGFMKIVNQGSCSRDSMVHGFASKTFKGLGFKSYKERDAKSADRVVVQLNSLQKICSTGNIAHEYDLIIMDEVVTVLTHFGDNQNFKYRHNTFNLLKHLCTNVKKMIVMDADIEKSNHTKWFLNECDREVSTIRSKECYDKTLWGKYCSCGFSGRPEKFPPGSQANHRH